MKNIYILILMLVSSSCFNLNKNEHINELRFINKNNKDSTIIKYLKDNEATIIYYKYNVENYMKLRKLYNDGTMEIWNFSIDSGTPFGDFYLINDVGKLLIYKYIDSDYKKERSIFDYHNNNDSPKVEGSILLEHRNFGDSILFVFPNIHFVSYDIVIKELKGDSIFQSSMPIPTIDKGEFMYKVIDKNNDISLDVYARGFFKDSVYYQNHLIKNE